MPETKEKEVILENLSYIGLDLKNIPEFLMDYKDVEYKLARVVEQIDYKVYRYIDLKDIQILLTPTSKFSSIVEKYSKAIPLCEYLKVSDILESDLFSEMLKKLNKKEIDEIEKEQNLAKNKVPFKVEYETNELWEIYYSDFTGKYFMLVSIDEKDYSALFYLLKKKIECYKSGKDEVIFVPISHVDYTKRYLNNSEIADIEKYIWLFTKDWAKVYEVFDKDNELRIHIVGTTNVYDKINSYYKIELKNKEDAIKFYNFLKGLFILKAELPHYYDFDTQINEKGELSLEFNNKLINCNNLSKFIKEEYKKKAKELQEIFEEKEKIDIKLDKLKEEELEKNKEYLFREKQVSTYLECRKSMFGKIKYFFKSKNSKFMKSRDKKSRLEKLMEENDIERSISNSIIEEKENYLIEDLIKICIELDRINLRIKNATLDIKALEEKIKVLKAKIQNATLFIESIEEHKKSIFEFWKFSNKDLPLALNGAIETKDVEDIDEVKDIENIDIYLCSNDKLNLSETKEFYLNPTDAINSIQEEKMSLYKIKVMSPLEINDNELKVEFDMSKYKIDLKKQKIFRINHGENKFNFNEKIICVYEYEAYEVRKGRIMKILSIETSGKVCAVALLEDNNLIKEELIEDENTHSVKLMPLVDKLLKETNTNVNDIDLFSCDIGPGSFTGIRIGVSTIKAFIDVTDKKAVGVTSLEILAENAKEDGIICSLIDAKNNNVYYGIFERIGDICNPIGEFKFDNINNIINLVKNINKKIIFVGNGSIEHKDVIESEMKDAKFLFGSEANQLNAKNIGKIAFRKKEQAVDSNNLIPIYLRKSNAERNS